MREPDGRRAYLCDGYGCNEKCAEKTADEWKRHNCHHTLNEEHAKNKCRRTRKWNVCADGKMIEQED
jgi:hypothetical protein